MDDRSRPLLRFDRFALDPARGCLRHGAGEVRLRPKAYDTLRYLAERADRLVSKDEIMAAVWPGVFVTDDSLVHVVTELRKALGDRDQRIIRTVPRRGYRFVAPVSAVPDETPAGGTASTTAAGHVAVRLDGPPELSRRFRRTTRRLAPAAAIALAAAVAAVGAWRLWPGGPTPVSRPGIAVLPFENVGGDEGADRLADRLARGVVADLARSRALDVGYVLEGTIEREGDRVRVTARLADVRSGTHVGADRWDRPAAELPGIQGELAGRVAAELGGRTGAVTAVGLPGRNAETDTMLARAWAGLARSSATMLGWAGRAPELLEAHLDAARRALSLDSLDPEWHAAMGDALGTMGDLARAEAEFDRALAMGPNSADVLALYAGWASTFGKPAEGVAAAARAIRLNPDPPDRALGHLRLAHFMVGLHADALRLNERKSRETWGRCDFVMQAAILAALGRVDGARAATAETLARFPDVTIEGYTVLEPGWSDVEREKLIGPMRKAGFPACARGAEIARLERPRRLPECLQVAAID